MIYKSLVFFSLCLIGYQQAGDYVRPTYKDTVLTPENLIGTLHQEVTMSPELQEKINNWMDKNKYLVEFLIKGFGFPNAAVRYEQLAKDKLLKDNGYPNQSDTHSNMVFEPFEDYLMFIAGKLNKINLVMASQGIYNKQLTPEEFDALKIENTYQTASRALGYLLFLQSKKDNNITNIDTPETYVVQTFQGDEKNPIDETTLVIQKKVEDANKIKDCSEVTEQELKELYYTARDAHAWNISERKLLRSQKDGKLYLIDLEQPNNTKEFMRRTLSEHERLSVLSIQQLIGFCAKCQNHIKLLKQLVELDEKAKQFHCYDSLGVTFAGLKEQSGQQSQADAK